MTSNVPEKMIADAWKASCRYLKARRKCAEFVDRFHELTISIRQDLRAQLVQERDTIRHINLQKEIELKELQSRLDRNVRYPKSLRREYTYV